MKLKRRMKRTMSKDVTLEMAGKLLQEAHKIVLCSHIDPDGDTLGSTLALFHALKSIGKEVIITVDDSIPFTLSFIPGIKEYRHFQADEHVDADLLVILDSSSADRAGNVLKVVHAKHILNIDHHKTNTRFAEYLYVDAKAAATAEIIYELLQKMQIPLTKEMAYCIFTGLSTDTGSFKYSNTTATTMRIAAKLLEMGVDPSVISDNIELKKRSTVTMLSKVLQTLTFVHDGQVAYIEIKNDIYDKDVETDSFISFPRYIEGVCVAILFKGVEPNLTRVSMRSKTIDVSKIALSFGGGGHQKAAGCSVNANLEEAKKQILAAVFAALS
jgi:phosphoesterase RecJ-like protein